MRNSSIRRVATKERPIDRMAASMTRGLPAVMAAVLAPVEADRMRLYRMAQDESVSDAEFLAAQNALIQSLAEMQKSLDVKPLEKFALAHNSRALRAGHLDKRKAFEEATA